MRIVKCLIAAVSVAVLTAILAAPTPTTATWKSETTFGAELYVMPEPYRPDELPPYPADDFTKIDSRDWTFGNNAASSACVRLVVTTTAADDKWSVYFSMAEAPLWGTQNGYWVQGGVGDMTMELADDRITVSGTKLPTNEQFCMVSLSNPPPNPKWIAQLTTNKVEEYKDGQACMDVTVASPADLTAAKYPFYFGWSVELSLAELIAKFPNDVHPSRLSSNWAGTGFQFGPWPPGDPTVQLVSTMGGALRVGDETTASHDLQICLHQW